MAVEHMIDLASMFRVSLFSIGLQYVPQIIQEECIKLSTLLKILYSFFIQSNGAKVY